MGRGGSRQQMAVGAWLRARPERLIDGLSIAEAVEPIQRQLAAQATYQIVQAQALSRHGHHVQVELITAPEGERLGVIEVNACRLEQ